MAGKTGEKGHFKDKRIKRVLIWLDGKCFQGIKKKDSQFPREKADLGLRTRALAGYIHKGPPTPAGTGKRLNAVAEGAISLSEANTSSTPDCVTLRRSLTFPDFNFLICKTTVITLPTPQGGG